MPWRDVTPMDEKLLFIADYLRGRNENFSHLCERYGISRKTGYKWVNRYRAQGMAGLEEQSRRPHHQPHKIPYAIRQAIMELRTKSHNRLGAKKLLVALAQRFAIDELPSISTINNLLHEWKLHRPQKKRARVPRHPLALNVVSAPNEVWSVDFKGQMKLANGQWCYPLTVMDQHSRFLLECHGLRGTSYAATRQRFIHLFKTYGLPQRIRSDNGVPFASRTAGGLSRLSIEWIRLGILPERIAPGKPQQNGRHERMHRTLKSATARPPAISMTEQQRRFDEFVQDYNEQRPHEALEQHTPASRYQSSTREYPTRIPPMTYPDYFRVHRVAPRGVVYSHNGQIYISHLLQGEYVGMDEIDDGIWEIYFGPMRLGRIDMREPGGKNTPYWTLKV